MAYKIRYRKIEYRGYGNYITRFVTKQEMLKYLKKHNPTDTTRQLNTRLKKIKVNIDKYGRIVKNGNKKTKKI